MEDFRLNRITVLALPVSSVRKPPSQPPPPRPRPLPLLPPPPPRQQQPVQVFDRTQHDQTGAASMVAEVGVKRKRGRPPKNNGSAPPETVVNESNKRSKKKEKEDEDVCFICFDGGNLVLCDRRDCPKAYHPACIKRDESFFRPNIRWNCGLSRIRVS